MQVARYGLAKLAPGRRRPVPHLDFECKPCCDTTKAALLLTAHEPAGSGTYMGGCGGACVLLPLEVHHGMSWTHSVSDRLPCCPRATLLALHNTTHVGTTPTSEHWPHWHRPRAGIRQQPDSNRNTQPCLLSHDLSVMPYPPSAGSPAEHTRLGQQQLAARTVSQLRLSSDCVDTWRTALAGVCSTHAQQPHTAGHDCPLS